MSQLFSLSVPMQGGERLEVPCRSGSITFAVGANGTGKSALMVLFKQQLRDKGYRIVAGRPLSLEADAPEIPTAQAVSQRNNIDSWNSDFNYRARLPGVSQRAQMYLQTLSEMEGAFHRKSREQFEALDFGVCGEGDPSEESINDARRLQAERGPLSAINAALKISGFVIQLKFAADGQILAFKPTGEEYGISQTSDGERAAVVLMIETLSAPPGQVLLIDEPERHIHRSLLHPLLLEIGRLRSDCAFIVSTHDIEFVSQFSGPVLLLREMKKINETWVADLVEDSSQIDSSMREDILGSRRCVLFVEGKKDGRDDRLYNLLFDNVSVVAKGSSRDVVESTRGAQKLDGIAWLRVWGVIDRDGRPDDEVAKLAEHGIWALPVYSVESIYYHPAVIETLIAAQAAPNIGVSAQAVFDAAINAVAPHVDRLAGRAVEKGVRQAMLSAIPKWDTLKDLDQLDPGLSPKREYESEREAFGQAIASRNWLAFVQRCPLKETPAPQSIATALGFKNQSQYEERVRELIATEGAIRGRVQEVLGRPVEGLTFRAN